jgi:hypothetical protein
VHRADNLTTLMCRLSRNPGALTSWTPQGVVGLFRGYFTFFFLPLNSVEVHIFSLAERLVVSDERLLYWGSYFLLLLHTYLQVLETWIYDTDFDCLLFIARQHDVFILQIVAVRLSRVCNELYTSFSFGVFMAGVAHVTVLWDFALCIFCCVFHTHL